MTDGESIAIAIGTIIGVVFAVLLAAMPGKIARERKHPQAEAIKVCGWFSILLWPLWIVAIVWAHTGGRPAPDSGGMFPTFNKLFGSKPPPRLARTKYRINGVDRESRMDTTWYCEADSEANARVKADLEGIAVTDVEPA